MTQSDINAEQKEKLLGDGFTLLPEALPPTLLQRWRRIAEALETQALEAHARAEQLHGACVVEDPIGPRLARCDDVLLSHTDAVLDLLACPAMMALAREFCGPGVVPLQLDILYKHQHPHPIVIWHQGAAHPRGHPYLNVGVYLDDAATDDGCLKYVPGTQHALEDICTLAETHGWEVPGVVEQPARAGDILVQDMMVLHGSAPKRSPGVRRTIYIEFRPVTGISESDAQSAKWTELRRRWMALVARRADSQGVDTTWLDELPADLNTDADEAAAIVAHWEPPIPAFYCNRNIETGNYPVPADMSDNGN
jgi:hypothetical protein